MKIVFIAAVLLVFIDKSSSSPVLPKEFPTCDRKQSDFNECLTNAVATSVKHLKKPYKTFGIPSLNPLQVPSLTISSGNEAVGLEQKYTNIRYYGLTDVDYANVSIDFGKQLVFVDCVYPEVKMEANYEVNGKILVVDVHGKGNASVVLENDHIIQTFTFETYEKNGEQYFKVVNTTLEAIPTHVTYQFDNLFEGDKKLSDQLNTVLNENWQDVYNDVKTSYNKAFSEISKQIFNKFLDKIPAKTLFGTE